MSLFSRLPDVALSSGLQPWQMGIGMAAIPVGVAAALLVLPMLAAKMALVRLASSALCCMLLAAALTQWADVILLPMVLFAFGFGRSLLEFSQNRLAKTMEDLSGKSHIARAHGGWSLGVLIATLLAGTLINLPVGMHLLVVGGPMLVLALFALRRTGMELPRDTGLRPKARYRLPIPDRPMIRLFLVSLGFMATENMIYAWGPFYLRESVGMGNTEAAFCLAGFTGAMVLMRLFGDGLRDRFVMHCFVPGLAAVTAAGLAALLAAAFLPVELRPPASIAGLILAGLGVALNGPLVARMALDHGDAHGFASLSSLSLGVGFLLPVISGGLVVQAGFSACFIALLPCVAISGLIAARGLTRTGAREAGN